MRKSRLKESEKCVNDIISRLERQGLSVRLYEVPVAMDEPDISFQLYGKGQYITSVFESFELEPLAMILEGLND